jgi:hypothetical protein
MKLATMMQGLPTTWTIVKRMAENGREGGRQVCRSRNVIYAEEVVKADLACKQGLQVQKRHNKQHALSYACCKAAGMTGATGTLVHSSASHSENLLLLSAAARAQPKPAPKES